jgi:hypothetical protein
MKRVRQRVSHSRCKQTKYGLRLSNITEPVFNGRTLAMSDADRAAGYNTADDNCIVWRYEEEGYS